LLQFGPEPLVLTPAVKNVKVRIYKTKILPVVLYGCETWSLTVREEHKLRLSENTALRNIWAKEGWSDWKVEKAA
jgi:hypothetical protein